jgi:hypothetical protein
MSGKRNTSAIFLLPGIDIKPNLRIQLLKHGFVNSYLYCTPLHYSYPVVFMMFEPREFNFEFVQYINDLEKCNGFIETIDLNKKLIMVFKVPNRFRLDYEKVIRGEYSKTSKEFQECFLLEDFKKENGVIMRDPNGRPIREYTTVYHVFNRTDDLKQRWLNELGYTLESDILDNVEFYDKPDDERESYPLEDSLW